MAGRPAARRRRRRHARGSLSAEDTTDRSGSRVLQRPFASIDSIVGRHASTAIAIRPLRPSPTRPVTRRARKAPMHGRIALSLFGFLAVFGMLLVNVTDPYAGATASPYYQTTTPHLSAKAQRLLDVETAAYESAEVARDTFTVTEKPK